MNRYYIGVDPGLKGAIAIIDQDGKVVRVTDTPTLTFKKGKKNKTEYNVVAIKNLLASFPLTQTTVVLEKMQSMPPGIRVQASFSLGYSQGLFEGLLSALNIPYQLVIPRTWQKHFEITKFKGDSKAQSYMIASKLFPTAEFTGPRGGVKDGRTDAALIAKYGKDMCGE